MSPGETDQKRDRDSHPVRVPYLQMYNTLPAVKKVSDCPLTLSESVPKKGLSVEALESRRTNIVVTRINVLYTTYCI